ncbi:peptidase M24 family protein [Paenibacillus selenitireducens]|uniref:Peptidase M24 family protein n=1 Tax=Paenibacillus selenitireducens TaxID=1324314 RepID=A0A1T2XKS3_9BACL|nr:Xaa-Pro peptidase family protein [Paenibacillus selenitireducens]OPA80464.1 peptidase M24 family protein [Paenibacillus selenitireducens]
MTNRLQQLYPQMKARGIDTLLITEPKHVYYFTGFACDPHERFLGLVVSENQEPVLIVPALDEEAASQHSSVKRIATHTDTDNPYTILKQQLPAHITSLGVEKEHLTVVRFEALHDVIQAASYIDAGDILRNMRMIKSVDEITRMKEAVRLVEAALHNVVTQVKIGVTEIELVAELEYQMKKLGAQGPSFDTMVLAGEKSALPHGDPGTRKVQANELLLFDLGVYADGYASDITRTFAVGQISDELQDIYDTTLRANLAAIAAVRPGVTYASIDRAARQVIEDKGYGAYFMHRLGHGLGMDCHEYPGVHANNEELLQEGVVFTIEPGIYLPNRGGVRIEDDIVVTADGIEVLTTYPKELTVIGG